MNAPHTLYYRPGACSLAPHIALEWIGAPYELVNAPRDDSFKEINPTGAVPALRRADGSVLTQVDAILQYVALDSGRDDLLGDPSPRGRGEMTRWLAFFTGDLHPAFYSYFSPARYTTDTSDEARAAVKAAGAELVKTQLGFVQPHLEQRTYFVGDARTIVDAYAVPLLRWVQKVIPGGLAAWPAVAAFYARMCEDAGVRAAMETQGISP